MTAHGLNPLMPFLMAQTPIIKEGINGFNPWANKEKNTKKSLLSMTLGAAQCHGHKRFLGG